MTNDKTRPEPRSEFIAFRLTPALAARIRAEAGKQQRTMSDWLRVQLTDRLLELEHASDDGASTQ